MTGPVGQVRALVALRWQMARAPGVRLASALAGVLLVWLLAQALRAGPVLDAAVLAAAVEVAPAAYLGFGVLAVLAPLTSGGTQVVPGAQLVAMPVRRTTHLLSSLLLAPLNLVWISQLLGLAVLTSCLTIGGSLLRGAATSVAYVLAVTVLGQLAAWLVLGLQRTAAGRWTLGVTAAGLTGLVVAVTSSGGTARSLASGPTHAVVDGVIAGGDGHLGLWSEVTGVLLLVAVVSLAATWRACRWALQRPGGADGRTHARVHRRRARTTLLGQLVAIDRASVWRAPAVRRAALVLAVLPGLVASGAALPWSSLVALPGLVAAGAALLFGVNAFSLDGGGALWLAAAPSDPRLVLRAKAVVLSETVLAAVVLAVAAGSLRSPGLPTPAEGAALLSSTAVCSAVVVALALSSSVRRPYAAELRGPRDAVAPPAALVLASIRLALPTAAIGMVLGLAGATGRWELPPLLGLPVLAACGASAVRTDRLWADPVHRAFVVHRVANG